LTGKARLGTINRRLFPLSVDPLRTRPETVRTGVYAFIERTLTRPHADLWVIVVATVLISPSIFSGLAADDFVHELSLLGQANPLVGFRRSPFDLFRFAFPRV